MSHESVYPYPPGSQNDLQWNQPPIAARSMSASQPEGLTHSMPHAYRTNTYPSFERRMTDEMQQISTTNAGYMPVNIESHPNTMPTQFREPSSSYQPINLEMQQHWPGGGNEHPASLGGSIAGAYSAGWYPQQRLTGMREGDDNGRMLPSQDSTTRRGDHNPG